MEISNTTLAAVSLPYDTEGSPSSDAPLVSVVDTAGNGVTLPWRSVTIVVAEWHWAVDDGGGRWKL